MYIKTYNEFIFESNDKYKINIDENGNPINKNDIRYMKLISIWRDYNGKIYNLDKNYYITRDGKVFDEDGNIKVIHYNQSKHPYIRFRNINKVFCLYSVIARVWGYNKQLSDIPYGNNNLDYSKYVYDLIDDMKGIFPNNIRRTDRNNIRQKGNRNKAEHKKALKSIKRYWIPFYKKEYGITDDIVNNISDKYINFKPDLKSLASEYKLPLTAIKNILDELNIYVENSKLDKLTSEEFLEKLKFYKSLKPIANEYNTSTMSVSRRIKKEISSGNLSQDEWNDMKSN